jgi:hypothetical protein
LCHERERKQLIESGHFWRLRDLNEPFLAGIAEREAKGALANAQYGYSESLRRCLSDACIALLLNEEDERARREFRAAVEYALKLIGTPESPGGGVRIYEASVELSEQDSRLTALHEKKPQPGEEKLSITDYYRALICVGCFGEPSQVAVIASVPEEAYQKSGTVASADYWAHVRAWKALLLGDEGLAHLEAAFVFSNGRGATKSEAAAMIALLDRQADKFGGHLRDVVKLFSRDAEKQPNDPIGVVFFPGLMLCRVAIDRWMVVEEWPLLPVRLLPNYEQRVR